MTFECGVAIISRNMIGEGGTAMKYGANNIGINMMMCMCTRGSSPDSAGA